MNLHNVPLEWIRAFEVSARKGSFTAAAAELNLTQVAISQRITNLERLTGSPLFIRKPRGISLTVEGETWLPYVSNALYELDQSFEELFGVQRKKITISASASVIEHWLAPRLSRWERVDAPQVAFSTMVLESETSQQDDSIRIRYGTGTEWPDHFVHPLFQEVLSPVTSPALLMQVGNWEELPRIAVAGPRSGWQDFVQQFGIAATPVPNARFDSQSAALMAAISSAGVAMGSLPICDQFLKSKQLTRVSQDALYPSQTYWIIGKKGSVTKRLWSLILESFTEADGTALRAIQS